MDCLPITGNIFIENRVGFGPKADFQFQGQKTFGHNAASPTLPASRNRFILKSAYVIITADLLYTHKEEKYAAEQTDGALSRRDLRGAQ